MGEIVNFRNQNVVLVVLGLTSLWGCSHSSKVVAPAESKREGAAESAVAKTEEDERMTPQIQKDLNAIFFHQKEVDPGGLNAFSAERIQALELALGESDRPSIKYYRENRDFFDRAEDAGGGFRIAANARRLVPYRFTKVGRRKLFVMDAARVKEMIAHPCFSVIEECGEYASDGEENTALLEEWTKKYPEKEFKSEREKVLRSYLAALEKYQKRAMQMKSAKNSSRKQDVFVVGSHIRGIKLLLRD